MDPFFPHSTNSKLNLSGVSLVGPEMNLIRWAWLSAINNAH